MRFVYTDHDSIRGQRVFERGAFTKELGIPRQIGLEGHQGGESTLERLGGSDGHRRFAHHDCIRPQIRSEIVDGGLKRRIVPVEFTNFFTVAGGIDVHYNCHFPKGWDEQDWGGFDTFIAESIQFYIANKLKVPTADLSEGGWLKQFEQTYGPNIHQLIEEHWENWVALGDVPNDDFKNTIAKFYDDNSIPKPYQPSSMKINRALEDWGKKRGVLVVCNNVKKVNGIVGRFRTFIGESPF